MPHLLNIKNQINRYQAQDPLLFNVLDGMLSELEKTSARHISESSDISGISSSGFGKLTHITNSLAGDFVASGGEVWNVVGVASIYRAFTVSEDGKLMFYIVNIQGSTIVTGGLATILYISLPPGYICSATSLISVPGWGYFHNTTAAIFEHLNVDISNGASQVILLRNQFLAYPIAPTTMHVRIAIQFPCEKQGV